MLKGDSSFERLFNQKCLTYTATAIYSNKLRTITLIMSLKFQNLLFSTNYSTHICIISCRKDIKKSTIGKIYSTIFCRE